MIDLHAKSAAAVCVAVALSILAGCDESARSSTPAQGSAQVASKTADRKAAPPVADPAAKAGSAADPAAAKLPGGTSPSAAATANSASNPRASTTAPATLRTDARGITDITFDTIKFDMQKTEPFLRSMLTPTIEGLAEKRVRIRGYILPPFQQTGLTQFVLVRDNLECCFGPGAALYDCILVEMLPGKNTDYDVRPVAVEGVFKIEEFKGPDGKHLAIYRLDGESVIH
jgi:hypothetical protein